jgi:hypothetical protein
MTVPYYHPLSVDNPIEMQTFGPLKPSNPKDVLGSSRVPLTTVSAYAIAEESLAMVEGLCKYGKYNYRGVGARISIYLDAAMRHLMKFQNGEERDPETGVHHLGSVRACMGIILDCAAMGNLMDDRPPRCEAMTELLDGMEARVKHLQELFKDHDPKHWTVADEV